MNQEDLQKALEVIGKSGIGIAGDLVFEKKVEYEVNGVEAGGIGIQIINGKATTCTNTEEDVKQAIEKLMDAKDDNGKYILFEQSQWYAIFRVLSHFCGYPSRPKDFENTIKNLGIDNLRVPCNYENYRKVTLQNLPKNVGLWYQIKDKADYHSLKYLTVALKLMELLNITG